MWLKKIYKYILYILILISIYLGGILFKTYVLEGFQIPTLSMYPTFVEGDCIFVWKKSDPQKFKHGDIIVFSVLDKENNSTLYIKRFIAQENERVLILGPHVWVNEQPLLTQVLSTSFQYPSIDSQKQYYIETVKTPLSYSIVSSSLSQNNRWSSSGFWTIPFHHVFVLGDFRPEALDSRNWGPIAYDRIIGKVVCRINFKDWSRWTCHF